MEDCLVHLRNQDCYERLTEEEALAAVASLDDKIHTWLEKYKANIGRMASEFITRHMKDVGESPFGQFYILYKIHKEKVNGRWQTRPVCSDVSSLPHALGKWITEKLVPIQRIQQSYFKDSFALKTLLDSLKLQPNELLFTSDASSVYTNIQTGPALENISAYLRKHYADGKVEPLIEALHLVFENNYFKLGDTFWKQKSGTAMGTPPAPPWATIFYALHENKMLPRWAENVSFYKRFINDVIGVWRVDPCPERNELLWSEFKADMNSWFGSEWTCTMPSRSFNFMDLTISIVDGRLNTIIYKKYQNLYLYIPPSSSHPKGVLTGLIFGQVLWIRRLCSER